MAQTAIEVVNEWLEKRKLLLSGWREESHITMVNEAIASILELARLSAALGPEALVPGATMASCHLCWEWQDALEEVTRER